MHLCASQLLSVYPTLWLESSAEGSWDLIKGHVSVRCLRVNHFLNPLHHNFWLILWDTKHLKVYVLLLSPPPRLNIWVCVITSCEMFSSWLLSALFHLTSTSLHLAASPASTWQQQRVGADVFTQRMETETGSSHRRAAVIPPVSLRVRGIEGGCESHARPKAAHLLRSSLSDKGEFAAPSLVVETPTGLSFCFSLLPTLTWPLLNVLLSDHLLSWTRLTSLLWLLQQELLHCTNHSWFGTKISGVEVHSLVHISTCQPVIGLLISCRNVSEFNVSIIAVHNLISG